MGDNASQDAAQAGGPTQEGQRRFFISRARADAAFAVDVAQALRAAGAETVIQDDDFGHRNFMDAMDEALRDPEMRVLALISPEYLNSDYCRIEAKAALGGDAMNRERRLISVMIAPSAPDGVLTDIAYISVVNDRRIGEKARAIRRILGACGIGAEPKAEEIQQQQILHPQIRPHPGFVGREAEMSALTRSLGEGGAAGVPTAALCGVGGIGKTSLAREYAWRHRSRYHGVWWIVAETRESLRDGLIALGAKELGQLETEEDRNAAAAKALRWIEASGAARPWLLIYDNVNDPADLKDLSPRENAHLIVTSRRSDLGRVATPASLDVLPVEVAVDFLCAVAAREDRAGAADLAAALGYLPLALEQAASYCREVRTVDFRAYLAKAESFLAKPHDEDENAGVIATFSLAIEQLAARDPDAVTLLELMSFCAPEAIPLDIFATEERDLEAVGEQAAALARWSLIQQSVLADGVAGADMHRLVQAAGRRRAPAARRGEISELLHNAALALAASFGEGEQSGRARLLNIGLHTLAASETIWGREDPRVAAHREYVAVIEEGVVDVGSGVLLDEASNTASQTAPIPNVLPEPPPPRLATPEYAPSRPAFVERAQAAAERPSPEPPAEQPAPEPPKRRRGFFARLFGRDRAG